ncbi:bifunctional ADP-dependent NAD(P)H-hydrate dehydratase/NAD(P)H-hydrate epimerase [Turneriella parva]|uniref:Bifunctional NAD(P)H-hydrate repair enzyme n=1 Tax=Turneriella parva (strain ATCC BAA-1111 / DSM 21527 / NCTC 11395 / H) TaxID=869212 RepID=I4B8P0_TURPD|nr:bifunctional ADP-dependent NAD(P)H-hydrate dehydratase/NAD(P)H-hydrate epimerase [Turneriella parva]AFM13647.1 YjeF-related protein [Turneriella parva DSM 21527]
MPAILDNLPDFGSLLLSREQMRAYDALAMASCKIPGTILMENAGRGAAEKIGRLLAKTAEKPRVVILCGTGNNGGDGFVVARQLVAERRLAATVTLFVHGAPTDIKGDAKINLDILLALGQRVLFSDDFSLPDFAAELGKATIAVDALFGTGLSRALTAEAQRLVGEFNRFAGPRVSLDLPSGLDADTGQVLGLAVRATHTVTFAHAKPGMLTPAGSEHCGEITVVHTGHDDTDILRQTGPAARVLTATGVAAWLSPRIKGTFKHRSGDAIVFAGSPGKTGAAHLAALAALRAGAGLVTIATASEAVPAIAQSADEIMLLSLPDSASATDLEALIQKRSSVALGPGFGLSAEAKLLSERLWQECATVLTVDADGLTNIAGAAAAIHPRILTPHSGEMARLLGITPAEVERDRYAAVRVAAKRYHAVVVLKGAHSLIGAPDGETFVSPWANPALATAGSGDVLTGIICALAADLEPFAAASAGVYLHGLAAHLWCEENHADRGMVASDIIARLPAASGLLVSR